MAFWNGRGGDVGRKPPAEKGRGAARTEQHPSAAELFTPKRLAAMATRTSEYKTRFPDNHLSTKRREFAKTVNHAENISTKNIEEMAAADTSQMRKDLMDTLKGYPRGLTQAMLKPISDLVHEAGRKKSAAEALVAANKQHEAVAQYCAEAQTAADIIHNMRSWQHAKEINTMGGRLMPNAQQPTAMDRFTVSAADGSQVVYEMMFRRMKHEGVWYEQHYARPVSVMEAVQPGQGVAVDTATFDGVVVIADMDGRDLQNKWRRNGGVNTFLLSAEEVAQAPGGRITNEELIYNSVDGPVDETSLRTPSFSDGGNISVVAQGREQFVVKDMQKGHHPGQERARVFVRRKA